MNANELADKLEGTAKFINNISNQYHAVREVKEAATMLRQQQAEIEVLKNREITDEEIWKVASEYFVGKSDFVYGFARAILRKAQEK